MTTRELFFYVIRKANKRHLLPEEGREELGVEAVDGVGGVGGVVEAQHAKEVVQHENRGQIERLDVLQLDQQLQEALADPQAPIEEERPELRDVREQNLVDQPVVQQLEESLRFNCRPFGLRGDTIRGLPRARRASNASSRAPESSTLPTPAVIRNNCLHFTLF